MEAPGVITRPGSLPARLPSRATQSAARSVTPRRGSLFACEDFQNLTSTQRPSTEGSVPPQQGSSNGSVRVGRSPARGASVPQSRVSHTSQVVLSFAFQSRYLPEIGLRRH